MRRDLGPGSQHAEGRVLPLHAALRPEVSNAAQPNAHCASPCTAAKGNPRHDTALSELQRKGGWCDIMGSSPEKKTHSPFASGSASPRQQRAAGRAKRLYKAYRRLAEVAVMLSSHPRTQSVYQVWGNSSCFIRKAVLALPI